MVAIKKLCHYFCGLTSVLFCSIIFSQTSWADPLSQIGEGTCAYPTESKANIKLIQAALGSNAEPCVTFPYLAKYNKPEDIMPWYHAGIDLKASYQTAYAVVDGIVVVDCGRSDQENDTACKDSMGTVMIESQLNNSRVRVSYVHMSEAFVTEGMLISAGTPIGKTGNRFQGNPDGAGEPHLHIEVRVNYTGRSAVGFISCQPDKRCDTREKVAALTMDPIRLLNNERKPSKTDAASSHINNCAEQFISLNLGEGSCGYQFSKDGSLSVNGETVITKMIGGYEYSGGLGQDTYRTPIEKLNIAPLSPDRKFIYIAGCDHVACAYPYIFNTSSKTVTKTSNGRYGACENWISWSPDGSYLISPYRDHGYEWIYVIRTSDGNSWGVFNDKNFWGHIDYKSLKWLNNNTFEFPGFSCKDVKVNKDGYCDSIDQNRFPIWRFVIGPDGPQYFK